MARVPYELVPTSVLSNMEGWVGRNWQTLYNKMFVIGPATADLPSINTLLFPALDTNMTAMNRGATFGDLFKLNMEGNRVKTLRARKSDWHINRKQTAWKYSIPNNLRPYCGRGGFRDTFYTIRTHFKDGNYVGELNFIIVNFERFRPILIMKEYVEFPLNSLEIASHTVLENEERFYDRMLIWSYILTEEGIRLTIEADGTYNGLTKLLHNCSLNALLAFVSTIAQKGTFIETLRLQLETTKHTWLKKELTKTLWLLVG